MELQHELASLFRTWSAISPWLALAIGGLGYLANIFAMIIPIFVEVHLFPYIMLPAGIAEIALTLWLLVRGLNVVKWTERVSTS